MARTFRFAASVVLTVVITASLLSASAPPPRWRPIEEVLLERAGLSVDDTSLVDYLHQRSPTGEDRRRITDLVAKLGSDTFAAREQAGKALTRHGVAALVQLRRACGHGDPEIASRARNLVVRIEGVEATQQSKQLPLPRLVVRLLARRQGVDLVPVLLRYLPFADDAEAEEEIYHVLAQRATRSGTLHPALHAALRDDEPGRRAVAGCILGWRGDATVKVQVRRLLADRAASVRLRTAQGLLAGKDDAGLPALVELLADAPLDVAWQAEELLRYAAGGSSPSAVVGSGDAARRRACRSAWEQWLRRTRGTVDWVAVGRTTRRPGLLLLEEVVPVVGAKPTETTERKRLRMIGCDGTARHLVPGPRDWNVWRWLPNRQLVTYGYDSGWMFSWWDDTGRRLWQTADPGNLLSPVIRPLNDSRLLVLGTTGIVSLTPGRATNVLTFPWNMNHNQAWIAPGGVCYLDESEPLAIHTPIKAIDPGTGEEIGRLIPRDQEDRPVWVRFVPIHDGFLVWKAGQLEWRDTGGRSIRSVASVGDKSFLLSYRDGHLLGMHARRKGPLAEWDARGRLVWEHHLSHEVVKAQAAFPLVRFGFADGVPHDVGPGTVRFRLEQLASADVAVRRHAAEQLARLKLTADEELQVVRHLTDSDPVVHRTLTTIALDAKRLDARAVPYLIEALHDVGNQPNRGVVNATLVRIGRPAMQPLIAVVKDGKQLSDRRQNAASTLAHWLEVPEAAATIREAFHDKDRKVQYEAMSGVCCQARRREDARRWIPEIVALIKSKDRLQAKNAVRSLHCLYPAAVPAVPHLLDCLAVDDVRATALTSLRELARYDPRIVRKWPGAMKKVMKHIDCKEPAMNIDNAAYVVSKVYGAEAKEAVPLMLEVLKDRRITSYTGTEVRFLMFEPLKELGGTAAAAVLPLVAIIEDKRVRIFDRSEAIKALPHLGPSAKAATKALWAIVADEKENRLDEEAVVALRAIDPAVGKRAESRLLKKRAALIPGVAIPAPRP